MKNYINVFTHKGKLNTELNPVDDIDAALSQITNYEDNNYVYEYTVIIENHQSKVVDFEMTGALDMFQHTAEWDAYKDAMTLLGSELV